MGQNVTVLMDGAGGENPLQDGLKFFWGRGDLLTIYGIFVK